MIKIQRICAPHQLTDDVKKRLTDEYKMDNKKNVWNKAYIREQLLQMSHGKCCYCECFIGSGKKEMHIDHYKPKSLYPDLVVEWENLLPSCPHCNKSKSFHDTENEPIINPTIDNPKNYFYLKMYRYCSKSSDINSTGRRTIDVLSLNDSNENVLERYEIGNELQKKLQETYDLAIEYEPELLVNTRKRNRIINTCRDILKHGIETSEFAGFMSTIIHNDENYILLKQLLEKNGLWSSELKKLHEDSMKNKFDDKK